MIGHKKTRRPELECLESRWVPATIRLVGGNLFISNLAGGSGLEIKATATPGKFDVTDNGKTITVSGIGNLICVTGTNAADKVTVDLQGNKFGGNVLLNLGNGNDTVTFKGLAGGMIGGSVTAFLGLGNDNFSVANLTIGGNVTLDGGLGVDVAGTTAPVSIGGNLTITNVNAVSTANPTTIGGNLVISTMESYANQFKLGILLGGNATITSGSGNDILRFNQDSVINGNVTANLAGGDDEFQLGTGIGAPGTVEIDGSVTLIGADGANAYRFGQSEFGKFQPAGALIGGNLTLISYDGENEYELSDSLEIYGNLTVRGGNGGNDLDTFYIVSQVAGNAYFYFGNGNNDVHWGPGSFLGGRLYFQAGNGNNSLTLDGGQTYLVYAVFGSGNDTFTLDDPGSVLTGYINAGGGSNTFNLNDGTLSPLLTLVGF